MDLGTRPAAGVSGRAVHTAGAGACSPAQHMHQRSGPSSTLPRQTPAAPPPCPCAALRAPRAPAAGLPRPAQETGALKASEPSKGVRHAPAAAPLSLQHLHAAVEQQQGLQPGRRRAHLADQGGAVGVWHDDAPLQHLALVVPARGGGAGSLEGCWLLVQGQGMPGVGAWRRGRFAAARGPLQRGAGCLQTQASKQARRQAGRQARPHPTRA